MTGALAQQIALISYGNAFLNSSTITENLFPDNSTFQFCSTVKFTGIKKSLFGLLTEAVEFASDPNEWLKKLKNEGCKELRLYYESSKDQSFAKDYMLAGFIGGGGTWAIETVYASYSLLWVGDWSVKNAEAIDNKVWAVNYRCYNPPQNLLKEYVDLDVIKQNLGSILISIKDFASIQKLDYWANIFSEALDALTSEEPSTYYYHKDLLYLKHHSLLTEQIIFASGIAFVFGGMGSWNDLGFPEEETNKTYEQLSETLYKIIISSTIAAINPAK